MMAAPSGTYTGLARSRRGGWELAMSYQSAGLKGSAVGFENLTYTPISLEGHILLCQLLSFCFDSKRTNVFISFTQHFIIYRTFTPINVMFEF